jgi:hypothetical protein
MAIRSDCADLGGGIAPKRAEMPKRLRCGAASTLFIA